MKREDARNLLGGYASDTLTPEEREALFAAAMEDQELFDALANEQALKEILDDPESRRELRAALAAAEKPARPAWNWWWTFAGASAVAAGLAVMTVVGIQKTTSQQPAVEVAMTKPPAQAPVPPVATANEARPVVTKAPEVRRSAPPPVPAEKAARRIEQPSAPPVLEAEAKREEIALSSTPAPAALPPPPARELAIGSGAVGPPATADKRADSASASTSAMQLYLAQSRDGRAMRPSAMTFRRAPADQAKPAGMDQAKSASAEPAKAAAALPENVGLRYQILRKNSRGEFVQTRLDTRFEPGDEIAVKVEKNAGGTVAVMNRSLPLPIESQTPVEATTAPIKLAKGTLELSIVLAQDLRPPAASSFAAASTQVTERSGNVVYVVEPGAYKQPLVATIRIVVRDE